MVSKTKNAFRRVVGTAEAEKVGLALLALSPAGLIRGRARVEAGVENDAHRAGLLVGGAFSAVPEVLTRYVGWPGKEPIGPGTIH